MKHLFKSFMVGVAVSLIFLGHASAITQTFTLGSVAQVTNVINTPTRVNSITIVNNGTVTNLVFAILDSMATNADGAGYFSASNGLGLGFFSRFNTGIVASTTTYLTNLTRWTTNFSGLMYTNTMSNVNWTVVTTNAFSNNWRTVYSGLAVSNAGTWTITPLFPAHFVFGVTVTNLNSGGGGTITIDHSPDL